MNKKCQVFTPTDYVEELLNSVGYTENMQVYNLEVEELHTYFVGDGVLVHNKYASEGSSGSNGKYEKADYHNEKDTPLKSKAPQNGQEALDNSLLIGDNTSRRIGISKNEFVVFDETMKGKIRN